MSRRKVDEVTCLTWEEALARNDVDAFVISTENNTHEEYVRLDQEMQSKPWTLGGTVGSVHFNTVSNIKCVMLKLI